MRYAVLVALVLAALGLALLGGLALHPGWVKAY